eukprot:403370302
MKRLKEQERKRQEELIHKQEILKAKLELEFQLIQERNKLQAILEGKMSAYLKQKIQDLQDKIDDLYKVNKDHVNRQRFLNKKIDLLNATLEEKQQQFKARLEEQRVYHKKKQDEFILSTTQHNLSLSELESQNKSWKLAYEKILDNKQKRILRLKTQGSLPQKKKYQTFRLAIKIQTCVLEIEILNSQLQDKNRRDVRKQELENQKLHGAVNIIAQEKIQMEADILKLKNQNQRLLNSLAELEIVIQKFDQDQERFQRQNLKEWIEELKKQVLWDKQL